MKHTIIEQGRNLGDYEDGTFTSYRSMRKHFLPMQSAWAFSSDVMRRLLDRGMHTIAVVDTETLLRYSVSADVFAEHSVPIQIGGFEPQLYLELDFWEVK